MSHELSWQEIQKFQDQFNQNPQNQVIARAASRSGIYEASFNDRVASRLTRVFSTELPTDQVTNQKQSGRCWEFASLNVLRHYFGKKYQAKNFTFSQTYNYFWDKIERANIFYDAMIRLADRPIDDREVASYLKFAGTDGGQWAMAIALVKKYGLVPSYAMPESFNAENSQALGEVLQLKEKKDALVLRHLAQTGQTAELAQAREQFLSEVYHIVATALGEPPHKFDLEFRDDQGKYHLEKDLTPQTFFQKYLGDFNADDYVTLANYPDHEYGKLYHVPLEDNIVGMKPILFLNVPMDFLTQVAVSQLKAGDSVMFGNDVLRQMDRKTGYLDPELYQMDQLLNVDLNLSKKDRLILGEGRATHAMTLVGVDEDHGQVRQWKVENSWGKDRGEKGYFVMSQDWFEKYVYHVVVKKEYLTPDQVALAEGSWIDVSPWDSMN